MTTDKTEILTPSSRESDATEIERTISEWETVGEICVERGMVSIGDPSLFPTGKKAETWGDFLKLLKPRWRGDVVQLNRGTVVLTSGFGDGTYNVEVRRVNLSRKQGSFGLPSATETTIAEMRIRFLV